MTDTFHFPRRSTQRNPDDAFQPTLTAYVTRPGAVLRAKLRTQLPDVLPDVLPVVLHGAVSYVVIGSALLLAACNPALNWRETSIKDTVLLAMLPCKPDVGARPVALGGRNVSLNMTGCDAGGATFAVAHATVDTASAAPAVLAQWRRATLANMAAVSSTDVPQGTSALSVRSALPAKISTPNSAGTAPMLVKADGRRKDGSPVTMQGLWFAKDAQVFHAVVYAERMSPELAEAAEVFFSGLKFQ